MADFLERMAAASHDRASMLRASWGDDELDKPVFPLIRDRFDLIAELKDRSPAEGNLAAATMSRGERAKAYVEGGAAAISVLTEPFRFSGEIGHVEEVVTALAGYRTPVMRKDFLVHTAQILEAKAAGASGVLLIAAILGDDELRDMLHCAGEHGMFVLLESFSEDDLERSVRLLDVGAYADRAANGELLFGVNTRDLRTLAVDPERLAALAEQLPAAAPAVAESGVLAAEDAARVAKLGYRLALVGTALMRSDDPKGLVASMVDAGRSLL